MRGCRGGTQSGMLVVGVLDPPGCRFLAGVWGWARWLQTRLEIPKEDLIVNLVLPSYSRADFAPLRRSHRNPSEPAEPKGRPDVGQVTSFALGPVSSGQTDGRALSAPFSSSVTCVGGPGSTPEV